jgi:hypothetical protein
MPKLKINKEGLEMETAEQKNVLTPYLYGFWFITPLTGLFILAGYSVIASMVFGIYLFGLIGFYLYHSIKNPDKLQSETYSIKQKDKRSK